MQFPHSTLGLSSDRSFISVKRHTSVAPFRDFFRGCRIIDALVRKLPIVNWHTEFESSCVDARVLEIASSRLFVAHMSNPFAEVIRKYGEPDATNRNPEFLSTARVGRARRMCDRNPRRVRRKKVASTAAIQAGSGQRGWFRFQMNQFFCRWRPIAATARFHQNLRLIVRCFTVSGSREPYTSSSRFVDGDQMSPHRTCISFRTGSLRWKTRN